MKVFKVIIQIIFISCLIISNLYIPKVEAKTVGDYKTDLDNFLKEYEENLKDKQLTEEELATVKQNINDININISNISDEIIALNSQIDELNEDIKEKEKEIEDILLFFQLANGENAYLEYAFGAKTFTDFIYRLAVSEQLTSYNDELVEQYKQDIEDSKNKQKELAQKQVDLEKEQENLQKELVKVQNQLKEIDSLSLSLEQQIEASKKQLQFYLDNGCDLSDSIEECETTILPEDTGFVRPLKQGMITGWYGPREPVPGAVSDDFHDGLDMSNSGANYTNYYVYPIADGKVIYTLDRQSCGGYMVFIQHNVNGQILISGYWHMRKRLVDYNEFVTKDTPIGKMGGYQGTEYWDKCSNGAHLHLEVSTGRFAVADGEVTTYYSKRTNPVQYVNVPYGDVKNGATYVKWYDRTTLYKKGQPIG